MRRSLRTALEKKNSLHLLIKNQNRYRTRMLINNKYTKNMNDGHDEYDLYTVNGKKYKTLVPAIITKDSRQQIEYKKLANSIFKNSRIAAPPCKNTAR